MNAIAFRRKIQHHTHKDHTNYSLAIPPSVVELLGADQIEIIVTADTVKLQPVHYRGADV
ncbi:MAG: hypothetical protein ABR985_22480 [Methanotrichaceae archaeon]|jgi:hypothetical protein